MKDLLIGLALLSCPAIVFGVFGTSGLDAFDDGPPSTVVYTPAEDGRLTFAEECAGCHGRQAEGSSRGPALIDPAYARDRLGDDAFARAVRRGVPARNPEFDDMPAFPELSDRRVDRLLTFVREMQLANGIR